MKARRLIAAGLMIASMVFISFTATTHSLLNAQGNGNTTLVSLRADGQLPTGWPKTYSSAWASAQPSIAADGLFLSFSSNLNLVPEDTNGLNDIYLYDTQSREQTLVSRKIGGSAVGFVQDYSVETPSAISPNGRYVAYASQSSDIVQNDTNAKSDVFIFDRQTTQTVRVSLSSNGSEANDSSARPALSGDGRFVVFESAASNLVANDTNNLTDIFVQDRDGDGDGVFDEPGAIATRRVSVTSTGVEATGGFSFVAAISRDGTAVAFASVATNLVPNDTNTTYDVFVHTLASGQTTRVSVHSNGDQATSGKPSIRPVLSSNGRFVAFVSEADNLVDTDSNGTYDVFVQDRDADGDSTFDEPGAIITRRVSVASDGTQGNGLSGGGRTSFSGVSMSGDGRYVAFPSLASNLVANDTNNASDVFVYDGDTDKDGIFGEPNTTTTSRVSLAANGAQAQGLSERPAISDDGQLIAFHSNAQNLVSFDVVSSLDVFLRNRQGSSSPPLVKIDLLSPASVTVGAPGYVAFHGSASFLAGDPAIYITAYAWISSIDGLLSQSEDFSLPISVLSPGTHMITLRAIDNDGDSGQSIAQSLVVHQPVGQAFETLILTNPTRMASLYPGDTALAQLATQLTSLSNDSNVKGVLVDLQSDGMVRAAYGAWDQENTTLHANQVAEAIKTLIDRQWQINPDLKYLVIVGDDRVIPFRRVADGSPSESPNLLAEDTYGYVPASITIGRALADNQILTDDYYGHNAAAYSAIGHVQPGYYLPSLGIGRLIESPSEILGQINAFLANDTIVVNHATVSAYATVTSTDLITHELVIDLGTSQCQSLTNDGIATDCNLVSASWTSSDFINQVLVTDVRNDIVAINHHAMHDVFGNDQDFVYGETMVQANPDLVRAILYNLGCHGGLNVPPTTPGFPLDLPQVAARKQANYVGNTGYGIVSEASIAYSENLFDLYTTQLVSGQLATAGQALSAAKNAYYSRFYDGSTMFGRPEIHKKVSLQVVLYGLPMYRYQTTSSTSAVTSEATDEVHVASTITSMSTGLTVNSLGYQFPPLAEIIAPNGHYYTLKGQAQVTDGQPIQPSYTADLSFPGTSAHGVVFRGGSYSDITPFDPVVATALNTEGKPAQTTLSGTAWSPSLTARLNMLIDRDTLVAVLGQYQPQSQTERIYQRLSLDIYYQIDSSDWLAPAITSIQTVRTGDQAQITIRANDQSGIHAVIVAYTTGDGTWQSVELDSVNESWSGSFALDANTRYFVQVVDGAGNVASDDNNGQYYGALETGGVIYLPMIVR